MPKFNPDNDNSLEIKRMIRRQATEYLSYKKSGYPALDTYKRGLKYAAETYAEARGIVPHTNTKWLKAKFKSLAPTYLCRCGDYHPIHDLALKTSVNMIKAMIEYVNDNEPSALDDLPDFYTKSMFMAMLKKLLTQCAVELLLSQKRELTLGDLAN